MNTLPFGEAPPEDMITAKVPDQRDDPQRPIGVYDDETGKHISGSQKVTTIGKVIGLVLEEKPAGQCAIFTFVATEGEFAGREFTSFVSFSPKARFKVVETYKALGLPLDRPYPKSAAVGVYCQLNLQDEKYEGRWDAKIKSVTAHPKGVGFRGSAQLP